MNDAERLAEKIDMVQQCAFLREKVGNAALLLTAQLERTRRHYGDDRDEWPAASEAYVRGLEDGLAIQGYALVQACEYAREIGAIT